MSAGSCWRRGFSAFAGDLQVSMTGELPDGPGGDGADQYADIGQVKPLQIANAFATTGVLK